MSLFLPEYIKTVFQNNQNKGEFEGVAFFIDIAGFTNLTENLMQHGKEGSELLHTYLEKIFSPIVKNFTEKGGIIPYYAGDAFLIIFEKISQDDFNDLCNFMAHQAAQNKTFTSKWGAYSVNFKAGVSAGNVEWGIVGKNNKNFYFKGEAIERAIAAWNSADSQHLLRDAKACAAFFKKKKKSGELRVESGELRVEGDETLSTHNSPLSTHTALHSQLSTQFFPAFKNIAQPQPEFQYVASLFISFKKIDTHKSLDAFTTLVADAAVLYGGYLKEIDFSDKGGLILIYFGAPIAFENSAVRGAECALTLSELFEQNAFLNYSMGLSFGKVFAGYLGSEPRLQYGMLGSRVNLAARLALHAPPRKILVDEAIGQLPEFESVFNESYNFKGFKQKQSTWILQRKKNEKPLLFLQKLVGREAELKRVIHFIKENALSPRTYCISIWGESGIGKSHFVHEVRQQLTEQQDVNWITCPSDQILRKPYNPFVYYLKNYFQQNTAQSAEANLKTFENLFQQIVRKALSQRNQQINELIRTESFLASLIGVQQKNSLWEKLDAKGRYDNTLIALVAFFSVINASKPTILELEDVHWLDEESTSFLKLLSKSVTHSPLFILFVSRYTDEGAKPSSLLETRNALSENNPSETRHTLSILDIDLNALNPDILTQFIVNRLHSDIAPSLQNFLQRTTQGNPFYAEQVIAYLRENDLLISSKGGIALSVEHVPLSESLQSVLMARIDKLSKYLRETIKVAAVIGREFEVSILSAVMSNTGLFDENIEGGLSHTVKKYVIEAERVQIWRAMSELRYIFRHTLLREAVYEMQLHSQLQTLHRHIADSIEKIYAGSLSERFIDLAFHYERANDSTKSHLYLTKAARFASENYQNQTALDLYDRLLKLDLSQAQIIKSLLRKGEVLRLIGGWFEAENCFIEAIALSQKNDLEILQARAQNLLGALYLLMGDYKRASEILIVASGIFEKNDDTQGIVRNYGFLGNLNFRQGNYIKAESYYLSCQKINIQEDWKNSPQIIANLGLTYMNLGLYKKGIDCISSELFRLEVATDKVGIGILYVNLGIIWVEKDNITAALPCFEKGLVVGEQTGDKLLCSIALGCIGNIWRIRGDFSKSEAYLMRDLEICESLGDIQGLSIVNELIARLHITKGEFLKGIDALNESLTLAQKINYQKGIAKALLGLGESHSLLNQYESAIELLCTALPFAQKMSNQLITGQILLEKGFIYVKQNNLDAVHTILGEIEDIEKQLGNRSFSQQLLVLAKKCADFVI